MLISANHNVIRDHALCTKVNTPVNYHAIECVRCFYVELLIVIGKIIGKKIFFYMLAIPCRKEASSL